MSKNSPLFIDVGQGMSLPVGLPTVSCWETLKRPKKPTKGTIGLNTQTNSLEFWNGTSWLVASLELEKI